MKTIGIVGCGTIGTFLAKRINKDFKLLARLAGLCDIDEEKAKVLSKKLSKKIPILSLDQLIEKSDLIIEAASSSISCNICKKALTKGKDVMVMSIGGLIKDYKSLFSLAEKKKATIILPSGAICGLDGLKSAKLANVRKVTLTTRKPPKGLKGAPYIIEKDIDIDAITGEQVIFEGTAEDAVKAFPKNINVSALLSIAGIGAKKTRVKIVTSPEYMVNMHELEVEGDFGRLVSRTENVPSPTNPKTSFLAPLSALATLKQILNPSQKIGT
ncbi:MAG: aspartate dehydrogenase [Candidatus Omnitrophica bacterium]|nr:aspartate dehydrogenase [Candidatus Omnitrophota bacterium]